MFAMMTIYIPKYENQTLLTKNVSAWSQNLFRSDVIHKLWIIRPEIGRSGWSA